MKTFSKTSRTFRPAPFWSLNDKLNITEMRNQMKKMSDAGYGAFFLHSRVGLITKYMSDEWLSLLKTCATECEALGLKSYLYDEDMWPSGYASGEVPAKSDDFKEKALVLALKSELELTDKILKTVERNGVEYYICVRVCKAGSVRFNNQCYIDTLNPNAVKEFLNCTHERYKSAMGELFGKSILGIFTDEPCYGIHWFYSLPHVTYSEHLHERIKSECGYDFADKAELLFFDEGDYRKTRYDYFTTASRQFTESFTKQYYEWCNENNLELTGHLMSEESLYEQAQWTGGVMPSYEYMSIPGIDKLMRHNTQLITLKQLTSVCEQLNKPRALSECFAGLGQESAFYKRKQIMDWQAVNGINFVNMHLSHYSLRGERKRDYPPNIFYQQPYFEQEHIFSDYAARLSEVAAYGKRDVKVLIIPPLSSVLCEYNTFDTQNKEKMSKYDKLFYDLSEQLQQNHIDFHYGDETIITRHGSTKNGKLNIGSVTYDKVILCANSNLSDAVYSIIKNVSELYQIGEKLEYINGAKQNIELNQLKAFRSIKQVIGELSCYKILPADNCEGVIACKRIDACGDIFLIANTTDCEQQVSANFFKSGYILDMSEGCTYKLNCDKLTLLKDGSIAVFCGNADALKNWGISVEDLPPYSYDGARFYKAKVSDNIPTRVRVLDENALPLLSADLFVEGELVCENVPLNHIWHYHFYKLKEGSRYKMKYRFFVKDVPEESVDLVIENAENLDEIFLNGSPVLPMRKRGEAQVTDHKAYVDVAFSRCKPSKGLIEGINEVEIVGRKYNNVTDVGCHRTVTEAEYFPTEAEAVYVVGSFGIFEQNGEYVIGKTRPLTAGDITSQGYPFYSGKIEYIQSIDLTDCVQVLMEGDIAGAQVVIKNQVKSVGTNPYAVTVLKSNREQTMVKIITTNTLYALLGPHYLKGYDELDWIDAGVVNDKTLVNKKLLIKPYGLRKISSLKMEEKQ